MTLNAPMPLRPIVRFAVSGNLFEQLWKNRIWAKTLHESCSLSRIRPTMGEYIPLEGKPQHLRPPLHKALDWLPTTHILRKTGRKVLFDRFENWDKIQLYEIMKEVVEAGTTYCMDEMSLTDFEGYFLSHDTFVVRDAATWECLGGIYLKPNFPGRSSHIGNCGYIVKKEARHQGIGHILAEELNKAAKDLGYRGLYGNLLYDTNIASKAVVTKKLRLPIAGTLPRAGHLKGLGYVDAHQIYIGLD